MKKTLLLLFSLCSTLLAGAQVEKTYTENLVVTINDDSTEPQSTTVTVVDHGDGTIDFVLNNFMLQAGGAAIGVGNIVVSGLSTSQLTADCRTFTFNDSITITPGDDPNVDADAWLGPLLGNVPLVLKGKMTDERLYVSIDIDMMEAIQQVIYVKLGTNDFPATEYTDNLVVTINDASTEPQPTTVSVVKNGEDNIDFVLSNFVLQAGDEVMGVGNIVVSDLALTEGQDGIKEFVFNGSITIAPGDDPNVDMWLGPMLGNVPLVMKGRLNEDKLYVTIDIDMMESIQQVIYVKFGDENFPKYYTATFIVDEDTVSIQRLKEGSAIEAPVMPEREGYTFQWGEMPETIEADTVIVGSYVPNVYTIYYKVGEEVFAQVEVRYGEALPEAPVYTPESNSEFIYTFEGWEGDTYETMPAHDVTYTAKIKSTPTAIDGIAADGKATGKVYDLQGRRVLRAVRGIYVIDGRKVMVK